MGTSMLVSSSPRVHKITAQREVFFVTVLLLLPLLPKVASSKRAGDKCADAIQALPRLTKVKNLGN